MSKVITFSRFFPAYHPRKGEETFFVEKIWNSFREYDYSLPKSFIQYAIDYCKYMPPVRYFKSMDIREVKEHTIRAGNRWKVGDKFSPRVWSGKPYRSKQIIISPDIEIKKVWEIKIEGYLIWINKKSFSQFRYNNQVVNLAQNDGLEQQDFWDWFPCKPGEVFIGQIICWNEKIDY